MTQKCFDEGTIQAFLDGELASESAENVACHVALCDVCTNALAIAEEENACAFAMLDAEINSLVPTERIRTRLFKAISAEKKTFRQRLFGNGFSWTSPHLAAFASVLIVVMSFAVFLSMQKKTTSENSTAGNRSAPTESAKSVDFPIATLPEKEVKSPNIANKSEELFKPTNKDIVQKASYQSKIESPVKAERAVYLPKKSSVNKQPIDSKKVSESGYSIAGEETYIRTIETLKESVDSQKDAIMRPSMRVAFEKDLAVVNDAIAKMRQEVRKNPKNEAAKDVLRTSYQNKIDLLNSVAEKNQLMATLK